MISRVFLQLGSCGIHSLETSKVSALEPTKDLLSAVKLGDLKRVKSALSELSTDFSDEVSLATLFGESFVLASSQGFTEIVQLLIASGRVDKVSINQAIVAAAEKGYTNVLEVIHTHSSQINAFIITQGTASKALVAASSKGFAEVVRYLLSIHNSEIRKADAIEENQRTGIFIPSNKRKQALLEAVRHGFDRTVKEFVQAGKIGHQAKLEALSISRHRGHVKITGMLMRYRAHDERKFIHSH